MVEISLETVKLHNKPTDLWVVIENKVYDLTKFRSEVNLILFSDLRSSALYGSCSDPKCSPGTDLVRFEIQRPLNISVYEAHQNKLFQQ